MTKTGKTMVKSHNQRDFEMMCPICQRRYICKSQKFLHKMMSYHMTKNHPEIEFEWGSSNIKWHYLNKGNN